MVAQGLIKTNTQNLRERLQQDQVAHQHMRRHTRHECFIISIVTILDRSVPLDGVITELSSGGVLFRPASNYILNRKGERISIVIGDHTVTGKIAAVRPNGYGISFLSELDEEDVLETIELYSN